MTQNKMYTCAILPIVKKQLFILGISFFLMCFLGLKNKKYSAPMTIIFHSSTLSLINV